MKPSTTIPLFLSAAAHSPYAATAYTPSSKASKSSQDDCPPTPNDVKCGDVIDSGVIYLGGNLVCEGDIANVDGSYNAAITVRGEGTVVDCQGYTVSQVTNSSDAAMDCDLDFDADDEQAIEAFKEECGLPYLIGIRAQDGATVRNCNIQKFYYGANSYSYPENEEKGGATFENIDGSLNYDGLKIFDSVSDDAQYNIINSNFYNNGGDGVYVFSSNGGIKTSFIDDVVSKNNGVHGISVAGSGFFTIRNVEAVNNAGAGMKSFGIADPYNVTLDGQVHLNNNNNGLELLNYVPTATVTVVGDLVTDRNSNDGIVNESPDGTMVLGNSDSSSSGKSGKAGSSGSVKACMNGNVDIDGPFGSFKGDDYTCDGELSKCNECYPGCFL